jgi:hypothetical protein
MYKNKSQLRTILFESFNDREENFYYLAPDIVGSVASANMDMNKDVFTIDFITTDGRNMKLKVKNNSVNSWMDKSDCENSGMIDFVKDFISSSKSEEEMESGTLEEIVDEYGDIIGNDDMPNNSNNSMVGNSKFGSEKAIKQTIAKSKRYYGDLGLGVITW